MSTESNYADVVDAIGAQLRNYFQAQGINIRVWVEEDATLGLPDDGGRAVIVESTRRYSSPGQSMAAGKRLRNRFVVVVTCIGFDMENFRNAAGKRDDVIDKVELGIMGDRTIGNRVVNLEITGGDFYRSQSPGPAPAFASYGETMIEMDVSAIS